MCLVQPAAGMHECMTSLLYDSCDFELTVTLMSSFYRYLHGTRINRRKTLLYEWPSSYIAQIATSIRCDAFEIGQSPHMCYTIRES